MRSTLSLPLAIAAAVLQAVSQPVPGAPDPASVATATPGPTPIRINCGGPGYTDSAGQTWAADNSFGGGYTKIYPPSQSVAGTTGAYLYQSERFAQTLTYNIAVANGTHTVTLDFAEMYFTAAGKRVFGVSLEGQTVVQNLDIWALAGKSAALQRTFSVTVNDGVLNIVGTASVNNAKFAAIEVKPSQPNQRPVVNAGADQTINLPGSVTLSGSASDDGLPTPPGALTYFWSVVNGPGSVSFGNANTVGTTATFSARGSYALQLSASDGALSNTDTVIITANAVTPTPSATPTPTPTPVAFRIAVSSDGNWHDRDDICATAMTIAELASTGNQSRLVHYDYADHYWITNATREEEMRISAVDTAKVWGGFDLSVFYNSTQLRSLAVTHLTGEINKSSVSNPLRVLGLGPMQVIGLAVAQSDPSKRQYVTLVSHSGWNDIHATSYGPGEGLSGPAYSYSNIGTMGVNLLHIIDQNAGTNKAYSEYYWLRDSADSRLRWLWNRGQAASKGTFDCSDAGETYFVLTGDQNCTPLKLKAILGGGP